MGVYGIASRLYGLGFRVSLVGCMVWVFLMTNRIFNDKQNTPPVKVGVSTGKEFT